MSAGAIVDAAKDGVTVDEADYVVIGSGAGGGAAARTLAKSGRSVAVLEEGPHLTREMLSPVMHEGMAMAYRNNGKFVALGKPTMPILQGRCVGGTTFVNSAIIWRLPEKILQRWHAEFGLAEGIPEKDLLAAYETIEAEMKVRPVAEAIAGRSSLLMREGATRMKIEGRLLHRSEEGCKGSGRCLFGCPNEAKQSTTINFLKHAVADGANVIAHAKVERILTEGRRATTVIGRIDGRGARSGRPFRVRARRAVVVAASVVQSPNLLRRSGIGREGGALGDHFMAHPGTAVGALYPEAVDMTKGASQGYEAIGMRDTIGVKFESINVPPEVAAGRFPGAGAGLAKYIDRLGHLATWSAAVRAEAEGTIRPSWWMGDLVRYSMTPADVDRLRTGLRVLAEMHFIAGAVEVLPSVYGLPDVLTSPDQLKLFDSAPLDPRAYSIVSTHLFGGCRAGREARGAVVDPRLKVHGIDNLYVMDASVFPTNTGVNPQHSIMAVALVAAGRLAAA